MTGRYAANVGLGIAFVPGNPGGLEPEHVTMADILAEMGYTNHLVGKWHLGNSKTHYLPLNRGFHNFYGVLGKLGQHFFLLHHCFLFRWWTELLDKAGWGWQV